MGTRSKKSQTSMIFQHMRARDHITALEALGLYGVFRLAARIEELRRRGVKITTDVVYDVTGKRYARYRLTDRVCG